MANPFKPGHDPRRNTKGRPRKEQCIPDILRKLLKEKSETGASKLTEILRTGIDKAARGDLEWVKFIAERTEGKVKDVLDLYTADLPSVDDMARYLTAQEIASARRERWEPGRIRALVESRQNTERERGEP